MGLKDKIKNFVSPVDETEELEMNLDEVEALSDYEKPNKNVSKLPTDVKMVLFDPRTYEEVEEIASFLMQRRAIVVNLHRLQRDSAQRMIDFLQGVLFALDGTIQKVGNNIFLCTPRSIGVQGEINLDNDDSERFE